MAVRLPACASVHVNPTQAEMRVLALGEMPRITETEFGNLSYESEVTARLKNSTFFVTDTENHQNRISSVDAARWAELQDEYIVDKDMILLTGYIGPDAGFQTGCELFIESSNANIPGMQQQLFFPADGKWEREFTVIYTPGLSAPGMPDDRLIMVDLENYVTRVIGSDYFGESKMGQLRMWNHLIFNRGGLALHSGLKVFPADQNPNGVEQSALIIGLSGTGKTTTTFRQQLGSLPVQDDFVALMPGGEVYASENGCFAKAYGLDADDEPTIHGGTVRSDAWLENVAVSSEGVVDFFDTSHTANGRSTFPLENIRHRDPKDVPRANFLLILNRQDRITPAVAKLRRDQIAGYFMLGETKGTSAGGKAEAGKNLRVPGTNPFFFDDDAMQANRLMDLLETMPALQAYVMSTGRVGGDEDVEGSKKIRIPHSSAIVQGIVEGTIEWVDDPEFGYQVAASVPGIDDPELLQPSKLYERQGRGAEYSDLVIKLKEERNEYLAGYPALDPSIPEGILPLALR